MKVRKDVYGLPKGDTTLEWYEKAVALMKTRDTSDPTSWAYLGAIHGISPNPQWNYYWSQYAPFPPKTETDGFWERCQHQSWYFLPWHRMYLAYFEQIVAQAIVELGGPDDWALPFWNYCDTENPLALDIPEAFTTPADSSNNLWMPNRHNQVDRSSVTLKALKKKIYTTSPQETGYGGPETKFNHGGGSNGALESYPHNHVHVDIGGAMGNPDTAGLDPIFWLHHANIDRLWQVWLNEGEGRSNPDEKNWLNFKFNFHDKDKQAVTLTPKEVEDTRKVLSGYTYEGVAPSAPGAVTKAAKGAVAGRKMAVMPLEIVDATQKAQALTAQPSRVSLSLSAKKASRKSAKTVSKQEGGKRMMLRFENIKGTGLVPVQSVYLEIPGEDGIPQAYLAGSLALFGLERASTADEHHSGSGLSEHLDITELVNSLQDSGKFNADKLDVLIQSNRPMPNESSVSVGKISLYSE